MIRRLALTALVVGAHVFLIAFSPRHVAHRGAGV
jgi:hypothetical protein